MSLAPGLQYPAGEERYRAQLLRPRGSHLRRRQRRLDGSYVKSMSSLDGDSVDDPSIRPPGGDVSLYDIMDQDFVPY